MTTGWLERVRHDSGLTQDEWASRAGTSRPTLSAYEHGRKSPTLATLERLLAVAGYEIATEPLVEFSEVTPSRGRPASVPNRLWRLPVREALATVTLPLDLNWSRPGAEFRLADRRERARLYEIVLREGSPDDIRRYIDGSLLIDAWPDIVLPREIRRAWQPVIDAATE